MVLNPSSERRSGFSLIEMVLVIAISGVLLTGALTWLVTLTDIWMTHGEDAYFDQHVDGVGVFLNNTVAMSEGIEGVTAGPVFWSRPPEWDDHKDPMLTFVLKDPPALLVSKGPTMPGIYCYLYFDDKEGLSFFWHSRLELIENFKDVRRTLISPFVEKIEYCYYDIEDDKWEIEEEPEEDDEKFVLPDFLKIYFKYEEEDREREVQVYIPSASRNVPVS